MDFFSQWQLKCICIRIWIQIYILIWISLHINAKDIDMPQRQVEKTEKQKDEIGWICIGLKQNC